MITDWPCVATYVLCVIGAPLFGSTLAPRRSIAFRNRAGTWSRAPGKQFGVLDRWRDRHTRPARWSDTLGIRPVRWRKWNRIRIDLARLADPISRRSCGASGAIFLPVIHFIWASDQWVNSKHSCSNAKAEIQPPELASGCSYQQFIFNSNNFRDIPRKLAITTYVDYIGVSIWNLVLQCA